MEKTILAIAGSDSCAGAGIQIDIKTAAAHGVHATCAITAVTAQNTQEVTAVEPVDVDTVRAQIDAVFADMPPAAIKIGMLGNAGVARAVVDALAEHADIPVVLDPVLVATAGGVLTEAGVFEFMRDSLIPLATLITPNIPEAMQLTGVDACNAAGMQQAAQTLLEQGARSVLVKGGHSAEDTLVDRLYHGGDVHEFASKRLPGEYHGTGCSLSTAIACNLACGLSMVQAVAEAHDFVARALARPLDLGRGVHVFDPLRASSVWTSARK